MSVLKHLLFTSFCILLLCTCQKPSDDTIDFQHDFYPVSIGNYIDYKIDSIVFSSKRCPTVQTDTFSYYLREQIFDTFRDNQDRINYKIYRYVRSDTNASWQLQRVWSLFKDKRNIQKIEENLRFIKLIFPPKNEATWLGNIFIPPNQKINPQDADVDATTYGNWRYSYRDLSNEKKIGMTLYPNTVHIDIFEQENAIERIALDETYAKGVGLVFKQTDLYDKQCVSDKNDHFVFSHPVQGYILKQTAISTHISTK